ncbi:MAG: tetratricopeptide repeat protein [Cyanobacteria bacterium J06643_13]
MYRGNTKNNLGRYEEALIDYNRAIELDANNSNFWNSRALKFSIQEKFKQAISDIDRAIELSSREVIYIANKGIIYVRKSEFDKAKECIDRSEFMDSDRQFIYYAKTCYFALQNKEQEAIAIAPHRCKREAKHNPDFDRLRDNPEFKTLINTN